MSGCEKYKVNNFLKCNPKFFRAMLLPGNRLQRVVINIPNDNWWKIMAFSLKRPVLCKCLNDEWGVVKKLVSEWWRITYSLKIMSSSSPNYKHRGLWTNTSWLSKCWNQIWHRYDAAHRFVASSFKASGLSSQFLLHCCLEVRMQLCVDGVDTLHRHKCLPISPYMETKY